MPLYTRILEKVLLYEIYVCICQHTDPENGSINMRLGIRFAFYMSENVNHSIKSKLHFVITYIAHFFIVIHPLCVAFSRSPFKLHVIHIHLVIKQERMKLEETDAVCCCDNEFHCKLFFIPKALVTLL